MHQTRSISSDLFQVTAQLADHGRRAAHRSAEVAEEVRQVLRELRVSQRLSRRELSERTEGVVSIDTIRACESRHRPIKMTVLMNICSGLRTSVRSVVAEAETRVFCAEWQPSTPVPDDLVMHVPVPVLLNSTATVLAPLRRWALVHADGADGRTIPLRPPGIAALADLVGLQPSTFLDLLSELIREHSRSARHGLSQAAE